MLNDVESSAAPDPGTPKLQREGKSRNEGISDSSSSGRQRLRASLPGAHCERIDSYLLKTKLLLGQV